MSALDTENPWLVVGLGNPGRQYAETRHNVGFRVVEQLAQAWNVSWEEKSRWKGRVARRGAIVLLEPLTFMNLSGEAVVALTQFYRIEPARILVVVDDMDLPLGKLRLRKKGSHGGHNGLRSIIAQLGSCEFPRLRLGIGRSAASVSHVLGRFSPEEQEEVTTMIAHAVQAVECALEEGLDSAMNRYNEA